MPPFFRSRQLDLLVCRSAEHQRQAADAGILDPLHDLFRVGQEEAVAGKTEILTDKLLKDQGADLFNEFFRHGCSSICRIRQLQEQIRSLMQQGQLPDAPVRPFVEGHPATVQIVDRGEAVLQEFRQSEKRGHRFPVVPAATGP